MEIASLNSFVCEYLSSPSPIDSFDTSAGTSEVGVGAGDGESFFFLNIPLSLPFFSLVSDRSVPVREMLGVESTSLGVSGCGVGVSTPKTLNAVVHISFSLSFCSSVKLPGRPGKSRGAMSFSSSSSRTEAATTIPPTAPKMYDF